MSSEVRQRNAQIEVGVRRVVDKQGGLEGSGVVNFLQLLVLERQCRLQEVHRTTSLLGAIVIAGQVVARDRPQSQAVLAQRFRLPQQI